METGLKEVSGAKIWNWSLCLKCFSHNSKKIYGVGFFKHDMARRFNHRRK